MTSTANQRGQIVWVAVANIAAANRSKSYSGAVQSFRHQLAHPTDDVVVHRYTL